MISSHFPDKYLAQALAKHRFKLNRVWISAFLHSWKGLVFVFCFDKKIKANLEVEQVGIQDRTRNIPAASLGLCWGRIPTFTSSSPFRRAGGAQGGTGCLVLTLGSRAELLSSEGFRTWGTLLGAF